MTDKEAYSSDGCGHWRHRRKVATIQQIEEAIRTGYEYTRTPRELMAWVNRIRSLTGEICNSEDVGKNSENLRISKPLRKFIGEAWPIAEFASTYHYYIDSLELQWENERCHALLYKNGTFIRLLVDDVLANSLPCLESLSGDPILADSSRRQRGLMELREFLQRGVDLKSIPLPVQWRDIDQRNRLLNAARARILESDHSNTILVLAGYFFDDSDALACRRFLEEELQIQRSFAAIYLLALHHNEKEVWQVFPKLKMP